jgi:biofilm PGA synthesis N-glycosyltransferase PgaC
MTHWDLSLITGFLLLLGYTQWWYSFLIPYRRWKSDDHAPLSALKKQGVSIIIPFRNESLRIEPLLKSLCEVEFTGTLECIFCNDHSTDDSEHLITQFINSSQVNGRLLSLDEGFYGKKAALKMGIDAASHSVIFTTDADCKLHPLCIQTLLGRMQREEASMVLGSVDYDWSERQTHLQRRSNWLEVYQCVENAVLGAMGWLESKKNNAAVANGANLMFVKSDFLELGGYQGHEHIGSGDDVFTLEKFILSPSHKVIHAEHPNAVVYTSYETDFKSFLHQRMRWMKKTFLQKTQKTAFKQVLVGLFMISLWVITGFSVYWGTYETLALVWLGKLLVDSAGVQLLCKREKPNWMSVVFVSALQVVWLPILALLALFLPYQWKARPYRA